MIQGAGCRKPFDRYLDGTGLAPDLAQLGGQRPVGQTGPHQRGEHRARGKDRSRFRCLLVEDPGADLNPVATWFQFVQLDGIHRLNLESIGIALRGDSQ